ncbi:MFS transporter [Conexibacter sp. JD483]|uniref:MFS transporter n=1 Tax=unclassified Conexibacter TaxID=2627773 RepID=UPI0027180C01|nr:MULTISPECIES: MFS transporter [unclassified Conexibacter]MDO8184885.1 MFS transporter [Conexibacter sp. CPCC 205706]MDO8196660.1 MFS transporter [Conexibacter sp. CPCC 205762]MDR9371959.1 MFS transporter [Conexibacter sp. JD483]
MDTQRPRLATAVMFFVSGAVIGVWAANVPFVRDRLDASTTTLGLCLLAMAAGSVLTMPLAGRELQRRPSRAMTRLGALLVPPAAVLPLLASTVWQLALALFLFGCCVGLIDVSMNAHGVAVERAMGTAVMSSLHAGWSFGGLAGAGATAVGHALGADPRATAAVFMVVLLVLGLVAGPRMGEMSAADAAASGDPAAGAPASAGAPAAAGAGAGARGRVRPSRAVVVIGALVFALFMCEGALTDWSALYLDRDLGTSASLAAIGYGAFAGGMACGRTFGDALKRRVGGVTLLRFGALTASVAVAAMLLVGAPGFALVALLLAGLGAANGVPLLFSAAGHARDMDAGPAIAAVSAAGYFGLLAGPPLLGFVADATTLPWALAIVALLTAVVAANARRAEG